MLDFPSFPTNTQTYVAPNGVTYIYQSPPGQWIDLGSTGSSGGGASVSTSDTPPFGPTDGDLWWDSTAGSLFVWYVDPDGGQWVQATPSGSAGGNSVHYATDYGVVADGVTDNAVTLQAAVNSFPANKGRLILPPGTILTSAQIELPCVTYDGAVLIEGAGKSATTVQATGSVASWAGKAVFYRHNDVIVIGGGLLHMTIEAGKIADYGIFFRTGKQTLVESLVVINARVTEGLFGDPTVPRFYETKFFDCAFYSGNSLDPATRPDYNLRLQGYATDNEVIRVTAANAKLANILVESGSTLIGCHAFGNPGPQEATYCYNVNGTLVDCYADGFATAGIYLPDVDGSAVACRFFWPNTTTGDAVRVAAGLNGITISNNSYYNKPVAAREVAYAGGYPGSSYIQSGLIYSDGNCQFIGSTDSLNGLHSARLQVSGTDFAGSQIAQGRWSADSLGAFFNIYKSRGATTGSSALVSSLDQLGIIDFSGDDGTGPRTAVRIMARAVGTPASGAMPGQLEFYTTPAGSVTPALRLILDQRGNVAVGTAAVATTATDGFLYLPNCAGPPTGVPTAVTGHSPLVIDSTTNKLYFYSSGAWRDAGP